MKCPKCNQEFEGKPERCPHCNVKFKWPEEVIDMSKTVLNETSTNTSTNSVPTNAVNTNPIAEEKKQFLDIYHKNKNIFDKYFLLSFFTNLLVFLSFIIFLLLPFPGFGYPIFLWFINLFISLYKSSAESVQAISVILINILYYVLSSILIFILFIFMIISLVGVVSENQKENLAIKTLRKIKNGKFKHVSTFKQVYLIISIVIGAAMLCFLSFALPGIFNSLAGIAMHDFGPIDIVIFIFIILYQIGSGIIQFFTWRQQNIVLDSVEKAERM